MAGLLPINGRLPAALGGSAGTDEYADLTLDSEPPPTVPSCLLPAVLLRRCAGQPAGPPNDAWALCAHTCAEFASGLKQARRLGGLTGWVHGTSAAADPTAQGTLRMYERIVE